MTRRVFYGWRIAAAGAGLQFLYSALLLHAFGAYVAVLSDELGWSKTALAGGAAIQSLEGALIGPLLGWLIDRFGPRLMVRAGVLVLALGFFLLARVETVTGFYVSMVSVAIGASLCGYFPLSVALVHFFRNRRARALSVMALGIAAGGLALPAIGWSMVTFGWRSTALGSGLIALVIGWPLASVVRGSPAEVGEQVDGVPAGEQRSEAAESEALRREFTAPQALRTQAFWLLGVAHALALLVVTAVNVHAISHMKEGLGYSLAQASFVITLMTAAQAGGILLGALLGDQWEKRHVAAACMVGHMVGLLMLTFAFHPAMLVGFALVHGVAWGLRGPFMQALRADYFGLKSIGMILGLSAVLIAVGQVAGPLVAGVMADLTGSYRSGFVLLALLAGSGSVMFMLAKKPVLAEPATKI
ncbi:MFS transporter [Caenimonas sp. SL110]|uniref:MFS transporter n=1 Tax=Caenimonas sp. SL110 TaxID=1450524 RepID=UPI0006543162|nr:MFS transporter [Caenimonas sp. SL110]